MPTQAYEEESNFPGLSVSYWLRVLYGQQASYLPLFFIHYIHFFPPLSFEAQRVSPHSYIKRQKSRLPPSGLPNWTASHFSFMPLYTDQGSGTKLFFFFLSLFLLPDNIKAICFVLWNVRSTGEIAKRSHNCDVTERPRQQTGEERKAQRRHVGKEERVGKKTEAKRSMKQREMKNKQRREVAKGTRGSPSRKDVRWEADDG